ncbi:MAG: DUF4190 domain-containing protein [Planctomycetota bacterium]
MSQFENNPYANPEGVSVAPGDQKTHGLAITSLVCSLACCIPFLGALGAILGVVAVVAIGRNEAKCKGKGMAIAAIIIGLLLAVAWIPGSIFGGKFVRYAMEVTTYMQQKPAQIMDAGADGDYALVIAEFEDATLTESDAEVFFQTLESRYGALQSTLETNPGAGPDTSSGAGIGIVPYTLTFENATLDAEFHIMLADETATNVSQLFRVGMVGIVIEDEELGDLSFPADF